MTPIKLNLGCGGQVVPGFIGVDMPGNWSGKKPDVESDLRSLPFEDGYADEVHSYHVIEHFYRYETEALLAEWVRVLKPGGKFVVECPCLDKILMLFADAIAAGKPVDQRLTLWGLYGDPTYKDPAMCHNWCFAKHELAQLLTNAGIKDLRSEMPRTHRKERDMRFVGIKG
jgi:SAM-dependent methyltransferase